jgi:hypothetical protein
VIHFVFVRDYLVNGFENLVLILLLHCHKAAGRNGSLTRLTVHAGRDVHLPIYYRLSLIIGDRP